MIGGHRGDEEARGCGETLLTRSFASRSIERTLCVGGWHRLRLEDNARSLIGEGERLAVESRRTKSYIQEEQEIHLKTPITPSYAAWHDPGAGRRLRTRRQACLQDMRL